MVRRPLGPGIKRPPRSTHHEFVRKKAPLTRSGHALDHSRATEGVRRAEVPIRGFFFVRGPLQRQGQFGLKFDSR